jgi:hypothetical protein
MDKLSTQAYPAHSVHVLFQDEIAPGLSQDPFHQAAVAIQITVHNLGKVVVALQALDRILGQLGAFAEPLDQAANRTVLIHLETLGGRSGREAGRGQACGKGKGSKGCFHNRSLQKGYPDIQHSAIGRVKRDLRTGYSENLDFWVAA